MSYSVTNAHHARTAVVSHDIHEMRSITRMATVRTGLKNQQATDRRLQAMTERIGRE
jgi:hypothetical protein